MLCKILMTWQIELLIKKRKLEAGSIKVNEETKQGIGHGKLWTSICNVDVISFKMTY